MDNINNFTYSTVQNNVGISGTSLTVQEDHGELFTINSNAIVCPAGKQPTASNAEIIRITAKTGDVLTITREQEGTSAKIIAGGWQIFQGVTKKLLDDISGLISENSYTWREVWTNTTAYSVNDMVKLEIGSREFFYICIDGHTSATADNKPGSGTDWEDFWQLYASTPAVKLVKSFSVANPSNAENITLQKFDNAVTIKKIHAVLVGSSSPSVTFNLKHDTNRSSMNNNVLTSGEVLTSTTTGVELTTFGSASLPANSFLTFVTTAKSGTVGEIHITVEYEED